MLNEPILRAWPLFVALCSDAGTDRALPLRLALATLDRTRTAIVS